MCFIRLQMARILHRKWYVSGVSCEGRWMNMCSSNDETSNFQAVYDRRPHTGQWWQKKKVEWQNFEYWKRMASYKFKEFSFVRNWMEFNLNWMLKRKGKIDFWFSLLSIVNAFLAFAFCISFHFRFQLFNVFTDSDRNSFCQSNRKSTHVYFALINFSPQSFSIFVVLVVHTHFH